MSPPSPQFDNKHQDFTIVAVLSIGEDRVSGLEDQVFISIDQGIQAAHQGSLDLDPVAVGSPVEAQNLS
jgi:hypothetical protein